ncbi:MAG: hypothetical protein KatS3mg122_2021 [Caldimonas sp.]|nr:MAG: hypothetical protein KatS3mg122_2021 [Caldimonas sp.]
MKTDDLLEVLREEFALAAPDVDDALLRWLSNPDDAAAAAEAATLFDRLNQACRVVGLDGLAAVLELLRDGISTLATLDRLDRQTALGWLAQWQPPVQDYLDQPASTTATQALIDFLRSGPLGLPPDSLQALREALLHRPADAGVDALAAPVPHDPDADAMSLEVPADVDAALYEAFLDDAPGQVATLAEAVRALTAGRADAACLHEARRVAHTLKGSGHIIGIRGIGRLAHRIEDVLDHAVQQEGCLPHAVARDLEQAVACLDQMVYALRGEEDPPLDAPHCLERLERWVQALHDGCAEALAEPTQPIPLAPPAAPGGPPAAPALHVPTPDETVRATLRIPAERLDRLVRRAAQALVHQGPRRGHGASGRRPAGTDRAGPTRAARPPARPRAGHRPTGARASRQRRPARPRASTAWSWTATTNCNRSCASPRKPWPTRPNTPAPRGPRPKPPCRPCANKGTSSSSSIAS